MRERIERLRGLLVGAGVDAFYVTSPENRFYLSGFSGTNGSLLISRNKSFLITDFRYTGQASRESPGFTIVEARSSLTDSLSGLVKENGLTILGCEGDHLTYNEFLAIKAKLDRAELKSVSGLVEGLRICKETTEIKSIEEAVRLADEAFSNILSDIRPGVSEREIALQLEYYMRRAGAEGAAFKFIVASGDRSALPHGVASTKVIRKGELVTLDFGAVYNGYHSDITRTVVMGRPDEKQKKLYRIVLEAQLKAIAALKAGVRAAEVDRAARDVIEDEGYGKYFGHGTGHGVGLNIHENPRVSFRDDTVLQPGMVVTVEPGIYLPDWGGVRIEDTVLVLEAGCRVLTKAPKDLIILS